MAPCLQSKGFSLSSELKHDLFKDCYLCTTDQFVQCQVKCTLDRAPKGREETYEEGGDLRTNLCGGGLRGRRFSRATITYLVMSAAKSTKKAKRGPSAFPTKDPLYRNWSFQLSSIEDIEAYVAPSVESLNKHIAANYEHPSLEYYSGEVFQYDANNFVPVIDKRKQIKKRSTGFLVMCSRCRSELKIHCYIDMQLRYVVELTRKHTYMRVYTYMCVCTHGSEEEKPTYIHTLEAALITPIARRKHVSDVVLASLACTCTG